MTDEMEHSMNAEILLHQQISSMEWDNLENHSECAVIDVQSFEEDPWEPPGGLGPVVVWQASLDTPWGVFTFFGPTRYHALKAAQKKARDMYAAVTGERTEALLHRKGHEHQLYMHRRRCEAAREHARKMQMKEDE